MKGPMLAGRHRVEVHGFAGMCGSSDLQMAHGKYSHRQICACHRAHHVPP